MTRSASAPMPAFAMFLGLLLIAFGVYAERGQASLGELAINIGVAINQFVLILATTNLGERNKELRAAVDEVREFSRLNNELVTETRAEATSAAGRAEAASREAARKADEAIRESIRVAEVANAEAIRVAAEANREAVRVAKGSEERATHAAAEITRLAGVIAELVARDPAPPPPRPAPEPAPPPFHLAPEEVVRLGAVVASLRARAARGEDVAAEREALRAEIVALRRRVVGFGPVPGRSSEAHVDASLAFIDLGALLAAFGPDAP